MKSPHYPVMLPEVLAATKPVSGETYIDATFGNGGYSEAILKSADCHVIGMDRDPNVKGRATELAQKYDGRFRLVRTPFSRLDQHGLAAVDAVIFDIGVSSMQLDQAQRGFSCLLYTSPSPRDQRGSRMPSSA